MLTKEDLEQLRAVVRDEVRSETAPIKRDIQHLNAAVWTEKEDVKSLTGDMLVLKEDVQRLEHKIDRIEHLVSQDVEILGEFIVKITEYMDDHAARIKRLEDHTGLSHS